MNHSLHFSTYYFFPICCTLPNDLKIFKHVVNLTGRMNVNKHNHLGLFFITNVTLWSTADRIFTGPKKGFLSLQMLISCNLHGGNFWNFFYIFSIYHTTRSYGYICPKMIFATSNISILQSTWQKILKFFPHFSQSMYYRILWFHV